MNTQDTPSIDPGEAQKRAIQHYRAGDLNAALIEARRAADSSPGNIKLCNLVAAIANDTKDPRTAIEYLQRSLEADATQVDANFLLGNAHSSMGNYQDAIVAFKNTLSFVPGHVFALVNMGQCQDKLGQFSKAERSLHQAVELDPNNVEANVALAHLFSRKTQYDKAEHHAKNALDNSPDQISVLLTYANVLRKQNRYAEAEQLYRSSLSVHPTDSSLLVELGSTLREQQKFDAASEHYDYALKIAPRSSKILRAAGAYYQSIRNHQRAHDLYKRFLEVNPDDTGMLNNMAIVLRDLNRFEESEEYYLACAEKEANPAYVYNNLGILAMEMAKPQESIKYYKKALDADPTYKDARSNMLFYMNYLDTMTPDELYKEHLDWGLWHATPLLEGSCVFPNDPNEERKLKIGYVSADFYGHAVSYFIESALRHHDKDKFEVYLYAHVRTPDAVTKRIQSYNHHWRDIVQLSTVELSDLIRQDEIDILVDLGGHTAGNRLEVFAYKPAPVQVTWIGYPNTTGLSTVDYRFVDHFTDPEGDADQHHSETLWRLPRSFTCYLSHHEDPKPSSDLAAKSKGVVTFGSFNNAAKISSRSIAAWAKILKAVGNSRLVLKSASLIDKGTQDRLHSEFANHGIESSRIEMFGKMSSAEHMQFYNTIDIGVDPYPYNGTTTSCEALWMGVPIVAMPGERHAANVTASLLNQVGLGELVAESEEDYVNIAADLASNLDRLEEIRRNLRTNMKNSPLCDHEGHTREVEDAYQAMWSKWCEKEQNDRRERLKLGRPEKEPYRPVLRLLHALGNHSFVQFCKCLGSMPKVAMYNDLHPLGEVFFPPFLIANQRSDLFTDDEWDVLSKRKLSFKEKMILIHTKVEQNGLNMVLSDWAHLDFIAQPYLPVPNYEVGTRDALSSCFDVRSIFVMRHPISQWASYCRETKVSDHISVEEFLRGYRKMAEIAASEVFVTCEAFSKDPDRVLKHVCEHMQLNYDPAYSENWPFNFDAPSTPYSLCLEDRAKETLQAEIATDLPDQTVTQMASNEDYIASLEILGYTHPF